MNSRHEDPESPVVEVVLLRTEDGVTTTVHGGDAVPLADLTLPENLLGPLRDAAMTLTASEDMPSEVVEHLLGQQVPPLFQTSPWLHDHRALVFENNRCVVAGHILTYRPRIGVLLEEAGDPEPDPPPSFDLLTQPWLPVLSLDGRTELVGLVELFGRAREFRRLVAEAPPMTAALHRLVLALFHRVYGPASESAWAELWTADSLPSEPLDRYVDRFGDRFDLFDPQRPFMQCPALAKLTGATAAKLIPYRAVGNNVTLFDHTTAHDHVTLTPAEAARWLVNLHSFDTGGMKTPFEKDKSSERAHCNNFGVVLVEGANLHETLLLNALVYRPEAEKPRMTTPVDLPIWEAAEPPSPLPDKRGARGWTDLLTWPSRRVLLSPDNGLVEGVVITPGVRLKIEAPDEEKMAAFRRPRDAKGKPKKDAPMLPVRLQPVRGVWRHSVELLVSDLWEEGRSRRRPAVLDQIASLTDAGHIAENTVYTLRVFGQQLDSKASVVESWLEDAVPAPVALLRAQDENLGALLGTAISLADNAGSALRGLQANFRRELRAQPHADIDISYWPQLTRPFADLLLALGQARAEHSSERPALTHWGAAVTRLATSTADRWVAGSTLETTKLVALGKFHAQFHDQVRTAKRVFGAEIAKYVTLTEDPHV